VVGDVCACESICHKVIDVSGFKWGESASNVWVLEQVLTSTVEQDPIMVRQQCEWLHEPALPPTHQCHW